MNQRSTTHRPILFHAGALAAGLLFGMGLAISRMIDPAKVQAFLDIAAIRTGGWDPSLAFVLGAAVLVNMGALRIAHRRRQPLAATVYSPPGAKAVDWQLITGSALFGVGWGLSGLCPGPAIADIAFSLPEILIFLVAMAVGWGGVYMTRRLGAPADSKTQASP
ncbi:transporter [Kaistia sp. 32K]|uniref:DUF6691 family protein n=1 Tax=Kaistia sp. 32K TaxID=2795690 RepID=UPI001914F6B7|nr:DUF6691 family protein [Kaistia sp. 32K]BCP53571.1 transporter [Kaistia sp. 32K]